MKKTILIICCLISFHGWSQPNKDSIWIEINTLKTTKTDLEKRIETVQGSIIEEMLKEEKLRSNIDNMIEQMDSLTSVKLKLQRKKQRSAQDQAQMNKLNKLADTCSNNIQDADMEITILINRRRDVIQKLQKNIDSVKILNTRIKELELMVQ